MTRLVRNSLLTIVAILCLGLIVSGTGLKLPAFARSAAVQDRPSGAVESEADDTAKDPAPALRLGRNLIVQTDKADYLPGELVVITSSGWEPGETVTLLLQEEPALHADRELTAVADAFGKIFNNEFLPEQHDVGVLYLVKATGARSGDTASTMFAQAKPAANLDQCANGGVGATPVPCTGSAWQNGNLGQSQAHYDEGESVPYRAAFSSLQAANTYTVTIEWDTTQSGKHALDYLTSFDRTETTADPCTLVAGVPAGACSSPSPFAIPGDPNLTLANGFSGSQVAGNLTIYNGTISGVSAYTLSGTYAGSSSTRIVVSFAPNANGTAVLAWGGHIATRLDWGDGFSAVAISGSPFHMRLVGFTCSSPTNCGVGNQDRSLSNEAVTFPGSITIVKDVAGGTSETDFAFTTTGSQIASSFTLDDDGDNSNDLSNMEVLGGITEFGTGTTRTVTETDPSPTFALTAINCSLVSQQQTPSTVGIDVPNRKATFNIKEGESATCTFVNTLQNGTLRVIKSVTNDNGGNAAASAFSLHVKSGGVDVGGSPAAGSATGTVYSLAAGSYTVSEDDPTSLGYTQGAFSGNCDSSGLVTVVAGVERSCTITNDDIAPTLTLIKSVTNNSGGNAQPDDFNLTIGGNATTSGTKVTLSSNTPYAINETPLTGYTFVSITGDTKCPDALGGTVTLDEGEDVTCTINNDDVAPMLTLVKSVTNDNGGNAQPDDFLLTIGGNATTSGTKVTLNANTAYAINETQLTGYTFDSISGDPECPAVLGGTVTLDEGDDITCTITNDDVAPKLTLIKSVTNDNGGNAQPDDFQLTIGGNATTSGTEVTLDSNTPYAIDETQLTGYTFVSITGDAKCPAALGGTITLDEGDDITCTIANDDVAPKLTLIKSVTSDNGGNAGPNDFGISIGGNGVQSGVAQTLNANTPYAINEAGLTGYTFVSITGTKCPDALGGTVTLDEGDDITCTITNDDVAPTLTLIKSVTNDSGGNAGPNDFGISIGGNGVQSGVAQTLSSNTPYAINETGLTGYTFVSITGDAKCPVALGGSVTLDEGENVTCTITNDDNAATLIVIKHVINGNGGDKSASDFTMSVTDTNVSPPSFPGAEAPGTIVSLNAGSYSVGETGPGGYTASFSADCSGTIANGETKTCTVTNNDSPIGTTMSWTLHDSTTISNFQSGGGPSQVTFSLYGPFDDIADIDCSGTAFCTETVDVDDAAGTASTQLGCAVTAPKIYAWTAHYSGNSANAARDTACGSEVTEIKDLSP